MIGEIEPSSLKMEEEDVFDVLNGKYEIERNDFPELFIASKILDKNSLYALESTDEFAIYEGGVYKYGRSALNKIREWITRIGNKVELVSMDSKGNVTRTPYRLNSTKRNEVIEQIKTRSFINEAEFDTESNRICVENGHVIIEEAERTLPNPRTINEGGFYDTSIDSKILKETVPFYFEPHKKYNEDPYKTFFQLPISYDPTTTCPHIEEFLGNVVGVENIDFIYEMLGYFLFPTIKFQKAFIFYGPPSSGKTTFVENLIYKFIGGVYWERVISNVKLHELSENFQLAELRGKKLNVWDDLKDEVLTETDNFRIAVTNKFLRAKLKHIQQHAYWRNLCKQVYTCNDLPEMKKDPQEQFWRRWILVDFFSLFTDKNTKKKDGRVFKKDPDIEKKITSKKEFSGLLNKCIEGFIRLKERGGFESRWNDPNYIKGLWLININPVKLFVDECCELDKTYEVDYEVFHKELNKFRQEKNVAPITPTMMTRSMKALELKGFNANKKISKKYHPESCGRNYVGIRLKKEIYDAGSLSVNKLIDGFSEYE
jgi:P4 family phage/plasmid primase-like protien